jgi:hypothetical protein
MPVTIERLPPERDAVAPGAAAAGGCCCCCCCCLHSLGGLVFAATARPRPAPEPDARTSVTAPYWLSVLVITLGALLFLLTGSNLDESLIIVAVFLPGAQLAASIVTLVLSELSPRPGRRERLGHLGHITLRGFLGGLVGVAVMYLIYLL